MSGPKSYSYEIDAAARAAALREAERARFAAVVDQLHADREQLAAAVAGAAEEYASEVELPAVPERAAVAREPEALSAAADKLRSELTIARQQLDREVAAARGRRLVRALPRPKRTGARARSAAAAADDRASGHATSAPAVPDSWREDALADAARLLARLDGDVDREDPEAAARAVGAAQGAGDARRALDALRFSVQRANEDAARRRHARDELQALTAELAGHESAEARALRAELAAAGEPPGYLLPELRARVRRAVAEAEQRLERRHVSSAVEDVLGDLGYEVGGAFSTLLAEDGYVDVRHPDWHGYAVRVRLVAGSEQLGFFVVRGRSAVTPSTAVRDMEVETSWCRDVPSLLQGLEDRGIATQRLRAIDPGVVPVLEIDDLHDGSAPASAATPGVTKPAARRRSR